MYLDLLAKYPRTKRDPQARAAEKTPEDVDIARQFGKDFFDGERRYGYGGYTYSPDRWRGVVEDIFRAYGPFTSLLDVGCAKGYMLRELRERMPKLSLQGIDVSDYAVQNGDSTVKDYLRVANANKIPYPDKSFDVVISINTIHNLSRKECVKALKEIQRVSKNNAYVSVDAYRTEEERVRMLDWNLTAKTILHADEWIDLFDEAGYKGDYSWWLP